MIREKRFLSLKFIERINYEGRNFIDDLAPRLHSSLFVIDINIDHCNIDCWRNFDIK